MSVEEKEHITNLKFHTYRLRQLLLENPKLFYQVVEYVPYTVFTNKTANLDINFANNAIRGKGPEIEKLITHGAGYLTEISCPVLYKKAIRDLKVFKSTNDYDAVFSYLQNLKIRGEMKYVFANKVFLDKENYFNLGFFTEDMGWIGKAFEKIFDPQKNNAVIFQKFQTLTKSEKTIMKLLAKGHSSKNVAEMLFLSPHSVQTHRKNIYKKLDIHKSTELVKLSIILDIF